MEEKIKAVLELQQSGVERTEIAKILEYKHVESLNRFMKKKGYIIIENKFVLNENLNSVEKSIKTNSKINYSFRNLDSKVSKELLDDCKELIQKYSIEQLKIISMVILKECIDSDSKEVNEQVALIKNVRTFFEAAFRNDFDKLQVFLISEQIPFDHEKYETYSSTRIFLKNDEIINRYLQDLSIDELSDIRKKLSFINPFTENFQKALRKNQD